MLPRLPPGEGRTGQEEGTRRGPGRRLRATDAELARGTNVRYVRLRVKY